MNIKTKEWFISENGRLQGIINTLEDNDRSVRAKLSDLLKSYSFEAEYGYSNRQKKVIDVQDWVGIALLIGELMADANYAMIIEQVNNLKHQINILEGENRELKNPELKK